MTEKFKDVVAGKKEDGELYRAALQEQEENLARYKNRIRDAEASKKLKDDKELIDFKIRNLQEQIEELNESLHYAKQDLAQVMADMDISGKATEYRLAVENIEKEIQFAKDKISELTRLK